MAQNKTQKRISPLRRKNRIMTQCKSWLFLLPLVVVLYLMIWRPTVLGMVWSFFRMKGFTPTEFIGGQNYKLVVTNTQFLPTLWNTVQYVLWSLVFGFLPPVIVAIIINELVHFKNGLKIAIYLPAVIPGIAAALMWYYIYYPDQTGLLNMALSKFGAEPFQWLNNPKFVIPGIMIYKAWHGFPATMLLYYASVQSVPTELYEAAIVDGTGPFKRLWHVTRPHLFGILLLNLVRQIIGVFQIMEEPLAMTGGGPNGASVSLAYQLYQYGFNSGGRAIGQAMAMGAIIFFILIIFTCFYFWLNRKVEENY